MRMKQKSPQILMEARQRVCILMVLTRVYPLVRVQRRFLAESFQAHIASEGPLAGVRAHVNF